MDWFSPDDSGNPFSTVDENPVAKGNHTVVSADAPKIEKTFVVDVMDLEADFVHVAGEHDFLLGLGVEDGVNVAVRIGSDFVGEGFGVVAIDLGSALFVARRGGGVTEVLEEIEGFGAHGLTFS